MKKILLFLFFLPLLSTAQKYQPFDTTMFWTIKRYKSSSMYYHYLDYYVKGYVMVNGRMWHKVYGMTRRPTPTSILTDSINGQIGFFSNDTANKRVYYVNSTTLSPTFTPSSANILFDFNINIGQFIPPYYVVGGKDSLLIGNKYHKRFVCYLKDAPPNVDLEMPYYNFIYEGVGSTMGVFNTSYGVLSGIAHKLVCFSTAEASKYTLYYYDNIKGTPKHIRDTIDCRGLITGLLTFESPSGQTIKLFPNPTTNMFQILFETEVPEENLKMELMSLTGSVVLKKEISGNADVDVSGLRNGVYLARFYERAKLIGMKKVVIVK